MGLPTFTALVASFTLAAASAASAQILPRGEIVDAVECRRNTSQHYALYLPSNFNASRQWPVILVFDAGGRGRQGVERYRAAAERYGYIVAGSLNSQNGPWKVGLDAAAAMMADLEERFPIDSKRMYTAGMSGGARVAIMVAQRSPVIAGVLASSAGYSTAFHTSERFPLFGSAGTEDFNYREMRMVDTRMTSPHHVEVFEGGHTWLPADTAMRGIEWMEIHAMRKDLRPRDEPLIAALFAERMAHANLQPDGMARMRALKAIAADFEGLTDIAPVRSSAAELETRTDVAAALNADRADDVREARLTSEVDALVRQLGWPERAESAFIGLKSLVGSLLDVAQQEMDVPDRRIARRVLAGLRASRRGVPHQGFQKWMEELRLPAPPQPR